MSLPGYDNWKTRSPHEEPTCPDCGDVLTAVYTGLAPPYYECQECEEEDDDEDR